VLFGDSRENLRGFRNFRLPAAELGMNFGVVAVSRGGVFARTDTATRQEGHPEAWSPGAFLRLRIGRIGSRAAGICARFALPSPAPGG
jgi:hypothetical protein